MIINQTDGGGGGDGAIVDMLIKTDIETGPGPSSTDTTLGIVYMRYVTNYASAYYKAFILKNDDVDVYGFNSNISVDELYRNGGSAKTLTLSDFLANNPGLTQMVADRYGPYLAPNDGDTVTFSLNMLTSSAVLTPSTVSCTIINNGGSFVGAFTAFGTSSTEAKTRSTSASTHSYLLYPDIDTYVKFKQPLNTPTS